MKFSSTLFAVLTIVGLGQTHQFPDFGSGPLHEDVQDLLDLVPINEMQKIAMDYITKDSEVQKIVDYLLTSTLLKDLMVDLEAIPEEINLLNYMQKEGVDVYLLMNQVNKKLGIKELIPPSHSYSAIMERTGGLAGLFKDMVKVIPFPKFIRTYVHKMRTSSAFVGFINQLKSNNYQQLVNKLYQGKSFQIIVNGLKSRGVNTQIVADIMYIILGITVPNDFSIYQERTMEEELGDFLNLIPGDKVNEILINYVTKDEKVQNALLYLLTSEFHTILRNTEALKEFKAMITYFENPPAELNVTKYIQLLHKVIGMEDYVPPKIESLSKSQIGVQKIGDGMKGMIDDIIDVLPVDKIDALYKDKLKNSKVFADFDKKVHSPELQKLVDNLYGNETFKNFVVTTRAKGLEFQELMKLISKMYGIKFPYYN